MNGSKVGFQYLPFSSQITRDYLSKVLRKIEEF